MSRPLALLSALPLCGCLTQDLDPSWLLDRTRVLAVAAEPAEPAPGDTVTFTSLVVDPEQEPLVLWVGCVLESSNSYGCVPDEEGFLGIEPLLPPSLAVPETLLDDLEEDRRVEGKNYILTLSALAEDTDLSDPESITEDSVLEVAYKRMPVSESATPNHNPVFDRLILDDAFDVHPGDTVVVSQGQTYDLDPRLTAESIEDYVYVNNDGEAEDRVEEPYFTFYVTDGSLLPSYSLYDAETDSTTTTEWTAPVAPDSPEVTLWIVARDRRGGMAWTRVDFVVE